MRLILGNHLRCLAQTNDIPERRVDEVLGLVGLSEVARKWSRGFSLGMSQRLGIAATMLGDPAVVMFDEPVNGLDSTTPSAGAAAAWPGRCPDPAGPAGAGCPAARAGVRWPSVAAC
jgi:ABC-type Mn2+/Zn2+ transport system ATPase subunit